MAATEAASGRHQPLTDGVLHAHGLGSLRDPDSRPGAARHEIALPPAPRARAHPRRGRPGTLPCFPGSGRIRRRRRARRASTRRWWRGGGCRPRPAVLCRAGSCGPGQRPIPRRPARPCRRRTAARLAGPQGDPGAGLPVGAEPGLGGQVISDDGDPSPLRTESAVRLARTPKAVTLTQRVMASPERLGTSTARLSSAPGVPSRLVKVRGAWRTDRRHGAPLRASPRRYAHGSGGQIAIPRC